MQFVDRARLVQYLQELHRGFSHAGHVFLVGQATLLFEGWTRFIDMLELHAEIENEQQPAFSECAERLAKDLDIFVYFEFPGDVIPLPDGYEERAREIALSRLGIDTPAAEGLRFWHFDPYSVAFRYLARGDEQDYQLVLDFLKNGWIDLETMNRLLDGLLPRFTFKTIQQDPAEFRRRYKGLLQMWQAMRQSPVAG